MSSASSSTQRIRQEMRTRGEATRPQLARACGLSLVTVNRVVAELCTAGELEAAGEVSSGGGRPVQLYRLCCHATEAALLRIQRNGAGAYSCTLELLDPLGTLLREEEARFAHLEESTLAGWLGGQLSGTRRLLSISLESGSIPLPPQLDEQLTRRHRCPCRRVTLADALAEQRENTCTLVLHPGEAPLATHWRQGQRQSSGPLELLTLPADWQSLNYEDHTLVEEMVARLLLTLTCTLAPQRFVLYGNFWNERLLRRLRYNLSTKLRGCTLPALRFRHLSPQTAHTALQRLALEEG